MTREPLSHRRDGETFTLEWFDGRQIARHDCGLSRFSDGRVAEVFSYVFYGKGSDSETYARDASIILSLALQHGTPLETIHKALTRDDKDAPATLIGAIVEKLAGL